MSDALRRAIRTLLQFLVAGGLTTVMNELADGMSPTYKAIWQGVNLMLVTYAQNELEDKGTIPAVLKAPASDGENPYPEDAEV